MTTNEVRRITDLNAELGVAMKALVEIQTAVDVARARSAAEGALKIIRSNDPREWEHAYLVFPDAPKDEETLQLFG